MIFNVEEKNSKKVSVSNIIEKYNLTYILCNDIVDVGDFSAVNDIHDFEEYVEYFQYFIVEEDQIQYWDLMGYQVFYHNSLNVFFVGVDHFGMGWDYILTDIPLISCDSGLKIDSNYVFENLNFSLASMV